MVVHLAVLGVITLLGAQLFVNTNQYNQKREKKLFIFLSEIVFFLVITLRASTVGLDTHNYYVYFNALRRNFLVYALALRWEPLYLLFNWLAGLTGSFQVLSGMCAAVICIGFGYFAYKNTKDNGSLFWFMFFYITLNLYFNSMHLMRQVCAMAISVNAYTVLMQDRSKKGYRKAVLLIIVSMGFHITGIIAVIYLLPFILKEINKKVIWITIAIAAAGIVLLPLLQKIVISLVPRFERYFDDDRLSSSNAGFYSLVMIALKMLMIGLTLFLTSDAEENKELYRLTFYNVASTALFILQFKTQFALRIGYFFEIFMLLYIPALINKMTNKRYRTVAYIAMAAFGAIYFIYMMTLGGVKSNRGTVPYLFFWQEQ